MSKPRPKPPVFIYLVNHDSAYTVSLRKRIERPEKYIISTYQTGESFVADLAHHRFRRQEIHIVFLGYHFADDNNNNLMNGIEVLEAIKVINPGVEVVMLSGNDETTYGAYARKSGAFAIVPMNDTAFLRANNVIMRILSRKTLEHRQRAFRRSLWLLLLCCAALAVVLAGYWYYSIHSMP